MRVLVTGAGGQLGADVVAALENHPGGREVVAAPRSALDVGDRDAVLTAVHGLGPDLVVNCAAWTAVDACEADPDRAFRDNALAVRHLAEGCRAVGAHLTTVSTDYVFDGADPDPYCEWDRPNPKSVYGASKLAGEVEAGPEACVVRTSWTFGRHGPNMVETVMRLLAGNDRLRFVEDQLGCPTSTADLAGVLVRLSGERRRGLFHVTNAGAVSWYELAREVAGLTGHDPGRVEPIATADLVPARPAARPANSVLDNAALRLAGEPLLRDFREPLAELVAELR